MIATTGIKASGVLNGGRQMLRRPTVTVWLWVVAATLASCVAAAAMIARI
jgi:hypothetical protein